MPVDKRTSQEISWRPFNAPAQQQLHDEYLEMALSGACKVDLRWADDELPPHQ